MAPVPYCKWKYLGTSPPTGTVEALYQFDGITSGLTDRSGNGHLLTHNGTEYYAPGEEALGVAGLELRANRYCYGPTGLYPGTTGAFTVEAIWTPGIWSDADDVIFTVIGATTSGLEAENCTVELAVNSNVGRGTYKIRHEYGAGNWEELNSQWAGAIGEPHMVTLTRASDGKTYKVFINGVLLETLVATNAVTGGGSATERIRVGGYTTGNDLYGVLHSIRYTLAEFSEAQVLSSYQDCREELCGYETVTAVNTATDIQQVTPIAKDVIKLTFNQAVAVNSYLLNPDSYQITLEEGSHTVEVADVLSVDDDDTTQVVYLGLSPYAPQDAVYLMTIESAGDLVEVEGTVGPNYVFTPAGSPIARLTGRWTHNRTKVDSALGRIPRMYDTGISSKLRSIIQAIATSDEEIGGDF